LYFLLRKNTEKNFMKNWTFSDCLQLLGKGFLTEFVMTLKRGDCRYHDKRFIIVFSFCIAFEQFPNFITDKY
jgi:hypothetical protein